MARLARDALRRLCLCTPPDAVPKRGYDPNFSLVHPPVTHSPSSPSGGCTWRELMFSRLEQVRLSALCSSTVIFLKPATALRLAVLATRSLEGAMRCTCRIQERLQRQAVPLCHAVLEAGEFWPNA